MDQILSLVRLPATPTKPVPAVVGHPRHFRPHQKYQDFKSRPVARAGHARLLTPRHVVIPFARKIKFPTNPLRVRRDRPRFLALIEASALLHQYQRESTERNGQVYLVATVEDYAIAREVAMVLLQPVLSGATPKCKALVDWVPQKVPHQDFRRR